jgi:hypothetical protein
MTATLQILGSLSRQDPLNAQLSAFGGFAVAIENTSGMSVYQAESARGTTHEPLSIMPPRQDSAKLLRKINDQMAPDCAIAWRNLVTYMNECVFQMLKFETNALPVESGSVKHLRLRAETALLERFRGALWFSRLVWYCQAGAPMSFPPPQELRPWVVEQKFPEDLGLKSLETDRITIQDGFSVEVLTRSKIAVWPVEAPELDWDCGRLAKAEYGNLKAFQESLSDRLSTELAPVCGQGSLASEETSTNLAKLDPRLRNSASLLAIVRNPNSDNIKLLEQLHRHPPFREVGYAVLCDEFKLERQGFEGERSNQNPDKSESTTNSVLVRKPGQKNENDHLLRIESTTLMTIGRMNITVIDLRSGHLVWEGLLHTAVPKDGGWPENFHEAERSLLEKFIDIVIGH